MKKLHSLFILAALAVMSITPVRAPAQEVEEPVNNSAYFDSENAATMSALIPVGLLVGAGVLIACTNHHSGGHSSSNTYHAH